MPDSTVPTLRCLWRNCSATFASDKALYDHLCSLEHFVPNTGRGFKCRWAACSVATEATMSHASKHLISAFKPWRVLMLRTARSAHGV